MGDIAFSRRGVSVLRTWCVGVAGLAALLPSASIYAEDAAAKQPDKQPPSKAPAIVCLHTEFNPFTPGKALRFRLMRELGRQAVLMAARDELGLTTRDETLGEVFPESVMQAKQDLFIAVRSQYSGDVRFQIWPASKPEELVQVEKDKIDNPRAILNQTENLEPRIGGELRDKLRALGFNGKIAVPNEKNVPPNSVEDQLQEMNFVSQFAAVRAAHATIAKDGPSRAWLGVLARGYANLSLMTEHHWKSDTEVFAARALLYAQRSARAYSNDPTALAERAYVWAIIGLHGPALDELKHVDELRKQQPEQKLPGWYELIEPYCSFKREPITDFAKRRPSMRQLAQRVSFEQIRAFGDDHWLFDSAKNTISDCPEEYGVFAALTAGHAPLAVGRTGAYYAPAALAHFLPNRIAELEGVPKAVRDAAMGAADKKQDGAKQGDEKPKKKDEQPAPAAESVGGYAADTIPIVEALRTATRSGEDKGEPSWSALGELIFEEQFVQAANFLNIAMNATESSHDAEVQSILPAIKGHRFLRHIESYGSTAAGRPANSYETIGDMPIVDPRGNMEPMIMRVWPADSANANSRGPDASWCAIYDRGMTFNGLLEAYNALGNNWWNQFDANIRKRWADEFHFVSPHSPQAQRFELALAEKPTFEQAAKWETEAGEDPTMYCRLGELFAKLKKYDDAVRVYERSIALSPTKDAFMGLANTYRASGQENLWQPTLERFFQGEPLGLEHAQVHAIIANYLIDKDKLEEAEPHAVAAGETYSCWGLLLASQVEEGLGHWDDSEKWIHAAANSYPSSSGPEWYFWCRRTGRGHLDEARKFATQFLSVELLKSDITSALRLFTFHLCENDVKVASTDLNSILELANNVHVADEDKVRGYIQFAIVSRELKETDKTQQSIKIARRLTEQFREKYPNLGTIYTAICDVLDGKPPEKDALAAIDKAIETEPPQVRVNCQYFLGRAYDLAGNQDLAEKYWKQCVIRGPFDRYPATLAGKYLCDRHKTSRP